MDDWRKMGPKNGENARRYAKKGYKPVPVGIKNAPRSWGERVIIPQSAALTAPNRCPSPLSLRAPARTRASQQSPGLLLSWRIALFESRAKILQTKKAQGEMPCAFCWSGLRDSNSLPPPWQGGALPDELNPQEKNMQLPHPLLQITQHILWCLRSESNQ